MIPADQPRAAVVVLHGSEGGQEPYAPSLARWLARRGFLAAAFCWFDCGTRPIPKRIERVPLDRTVAFVEWFRDNPARDLPVVLYGASRGAEQALMIGSRLGNTDLIDAIAVHAPSDTVVASYDPRKRGVIDGKGGYEAAWTWHGEPQYGERGPPWGSGPRIAIERYPGPVWLSHGADDQLWPASRSERLAEARSGLPTDLHVWPGEGHVLTSPQSFDAFLDSLVDFVDRVAVPPR